MVNVDESFPMFAVRFFEVESAALTDSTMMVDTGTSRRRVALIGVDRNNSFRAFNTEPGNRQLVREGIRGEVGIPDRTFFSQKTVMQLTLKVADGGHTGVVRSLRINHIEGEQLISLLDIADMFKSLLIPRQFLVARAVFGV